MQVDPRSPERGQYSFLQDLLKRVAYERSRRQERKPRHLRPPRISGHAFGAGEQEIVEVIAAHYLDAYRAAPDANDAPEIRTTAPARCSRAQASERHPWRPPTRRSTTSSALPS